ncbi:MAG TPA: adenosine deaminase [Acidimicrobiales bacterium]|nr:adenosine deaminase [Acidimicrobiales bacterium]
MAENGSLAGPPPAQPRPAVGSPADRDGGPPAPVVDFRRPGSLTSEVDGSSSPATTTTSLVDRTWVAGLPKAEVHLHLEGCIQPELVVAAARRHGVDPEAALGYARHASASLAHLLAYLDWSCAMIDRPDDLAMIAFDASRFAWASGTRHIDVILNPTHWPRWHGRLAPMIDALHAGFRSAEQDGFATATICLSLRRTQSRFEAQELLDWMLEVRHPRVSGLSLDGDESQGSHNERFIEAFARAREGGLRRCAHAGESGGARSVWEAMALLDVERIDHGIRCLEDTAVVMELVDRQLALDVCPTSNVALGVVPDLTRHPVESLRRAGIPFSINTDDPRLYGIDLAGEYVRCAATFRWERETLVNAARTSIASSFADGDRRAALLAELESFVSVRA